MVLHSPFVSMIWTIDEQSIGGGLFRPRMRDLLSFLLSYWNADFFSFGEVYE